MRFLSAVAVALGFVLASSAVLSAQDDPQPIFDNYDDMRDTLDELMSTRQVVDLLTAFGGGDEMTLQAMTGIETSVRNIYSVDFTNTAVMMRQEMGGGFAQEMIAYWADTAYLYVRVLWHEREDGQFVAINMTFNSDVDVILGHF